MPTQHCKRPVDLFRQHRARELMRHGQRGKGYQHIGTLAPGRRKAVMSAHQEDQIVAFLKTLTDGYTPP